MPAGSSRTSVAGSSRGAAGSSRGGGGGRSSSSDFTYSHSKTVEIPTGSRNIDKYWSALFSETSQIVSRNYALSRALGIDPDSAFSSPLRATVPLLTAREAKEYRDWEASKRMPKADWKRLRADVRGMTDKQLERWEELGNALRVLYMDNKIGADNAKAWVEKYDDKVPLLIAMKKVDQTKYDISRAGKSSTGKRLVHEGVACRKMLSEIGMYRGELGRTVKESNIKVAKKEQDLLKDLTKLESDKPRSKDDVADIFKERAKMYERLGRLRLERASNGVRHAQLMSESKMTEELIRARFHNIDSMLNSEKRRR